MGRSKRPDLPLCGRRAVRTADAARTRSMRSAGLRRSDHCHGCGPHPFPAPDLACRPALDVDERRNPEGAVGNGRGDEQSAGSLAEIASPSSGGPDILILAELGELRGYLQFGLFVLAARLCKQIVPVSRLGVRAELGELRGYLQLGLFVLPAHPCGQIILVSHGMSPLSPAVPLVVLTRQTQ